MCAHGNGEILLVVAGRVVGARGIFDVGLGGDVSVRGHVWGRGDGNRKRRRGEGPRRDDGINHAEHGGHGVGWGFDLRFWKYPRELRGKWI